MGEFMSRMLVDKMGGRRMKGTCRCRNIDWIKPLARIKYHFTHFGPEVCPDCHQEIKWEEEE